MTVPNLITSIRIILTPIFIIYLIHGRVQSALVVFILAGLTDGVDGFVARVFNQKSKLGAYLDPLADKILLIAAFVVLPILHMIPPWLSVVVISRDVLILLGVLILFLNKASVTIKPSMVSKVTTCLQLCSVFFVLSLGYFSQVAHLVTYVFWVTGLFTVTSGLLYMRYWFRAVGEMPLGQ